ncbi:MAG: hypothetical protein GY807_02105 [Gammaproteobacteria bacterium]|nr:hypothetical protein [Gammaproteobacteria bacterium]
MAEGIFSDAGLSTLASTITCTQNEDGSDDPIDTQLWIGSTDSGKKLQSDSDPGVDNIVISTTDSAPGGGHEATEVKLSLTEGGLPGATGGASLDLTVHTISGGSSNAVTFWVRVDDATGTEGTVTELSIGSNALRLLDI